MRILYLGGQIVKSLWPYSRLHDVYICNLSHVISDLSTKNKCCIRLNWAGYLRPLLSQASIFRCETLAHVFVPHIVSLIIKVFHISSNAKYAGP